MSEDAKLAFGYLVKNKNILTFTDALKRVKFPTWKIRHNIIGLRIGVKTAGCSGLKYIEYAKD